MVLLMTHHEYYLVQRKKNAVVLAAEVVDSLLWVERHSGTVTGLPPKERLQKRIHGSLQLNLDEDPTDIFGAVCVLLVCSALLKNSSANSTKIKLAR